MEWVSEMMSKNVEHKPTKFPELTDQPTPADLVIVPEGRGVRSASIFWCPVYNTYGGQDPSDGREKETVDGDKK